ncbi:hypothetical protein SADUNF_Sadunf01G0123600 [Salix dunnii]|uniref:Uncharacterized protein n=1 Tax=Salix dunnii TaxID=1413687 RepID=A0A835NBG3_9ROSI|nr:hypothetical protein SADUNF_Sadunf01G0123600 [Salix dunnii]
MVAPTIHVIYKLSPPLPLVSVDLCSSLFIVSPFLLLGVLRTLRFPPPRFLLFPFPSCFGFEQTVLLIVIKEEDDFGDELKSVKPRL